MNEIDSMDMIGYLEMRAWKAIRENTVVPKAAYIDQVWPGMRANV